ncbi:MAG: NTP transferase domain-containing protein [Chloroflexi bacterium]|nr:NTP transferase domain-containing protein [Chloroflexota bacterium]
MSEQLPVILLVGGLGTRMGPEAEGRPKALVEVGGRPIVWHIMKLYAHYGHTQFVFPLGYRGDWFRRYFLDYEALTHDVTFTLGQADQRTYHHPNREAEWQVTLFDAGVPTNKGARVRLGGERVAGDRLFATYGDGIGDVDIEALLKFHRAHGKLATLTGYQPLSQYGLVEAEGDAVTGLREKPRLANWVNAGFFVFERGALDYLQGDDSVDLEKDALPRLAADGQLMMYRHTGFWASMDTFKEAQTLNDLWDQGAPWKVWDADKRR